MPLVFLPWKRKFLKRRKKWEDLKKSSTFKRSSKQSEIFLQSSIFLFTHSAPFWLVLCFNWTCMKYIWVNRLQKCLLPHHNFSLLLWQLNSWAQRHQWLLAISQFKIIFSQKKYSRKNFIWKYIVVFRTVLDFRLVFRSYGLE